MYWFCLTCSKYSFKFVVDCRSVLNVLWRALCLLSEISAVGSSNLFFGYVFTALDRTSDYVEQRLVMLRSRSSLAVLL